MGVVAILLRCLRFLRYLPGLRRDLRESGTELILREGALVWTGVWLLGVWMPIGRLGIVRLGISVGAMADDASFLLDEEDMGILA